MSLVLTASGLRSSVTNFFASSRTSMTLLRRANTGARGKEATKRVTKPNCTTGREQSVGSVSRKKHDLDPFPCSLWPWSSLAESLSHPVLLGSRVLLAHSHGYFSLSPYGPAGQHYCLGAKCVLRTVRRQEKRKSLESSLSIILNLITNPGHLTQRLTAFFSKGPDCKHVCICRPSGLVTVT